MSAEIIYLASRSPRRCELLEQIHVRYRQIVADIDETPLENETPQEYVTRLANAKAWAGYTSLNDDFPVLGADTAVVCAGNIFGKPDHEDMAVNMLRQLSGKLHYVMTGITLVVDNQAFSQLSVSQVQFRQLNDEEINTYVATGEPLDKAGGYAIQGLASMFIERIEGSYSGIMGLPLYETSLLLQQAGIRTI